MVKTNKYIESINKKLAEIEAHQSAIFNLGKEIEAAKKELVINELCKRKIKVKKEGSNRYLGVELYLDITPEDNHMYVSLKVTDEKLRPTKGQTWKKVFQELAEDSDLYLLYYFVDYEEEGNLEFVSKSEYIEDCWIEEIADFYIDGRLKAFPL